MLDLDDVGWDTWRGASSDEHAAALRRHGAESVPRRRGGQRRDGAASHSLHGYFLRPGSPDTPIVLSGRASTRWSVLQPETRRRGAITLDHLRHDRELQTPEAGFEQGRHARNNTATRPGQPRGQAAALRSSRVPTEFAALDIRYVDDEIRTRQAISMRSTAPLPDSPLVHMAVLAYGCDLTLLGTARRPYLEINEPGRFMSASIDHAMWFHRPFPRSRGASAVCNPYRVRWQGTGSWSRLLPATDGSVREHRSGGRHAVADAPVNVIVRACSD